MKSQEKNATGINAYYVIMPLDEVLAQWTCEELNDALNGKKKENTRNSKRSIRF